jgi:hypothetical protein
VQENLSLNARVKRRRFACRVMSYAEERFAISGISSGRTDSQISPQRSCENPRAIGSCRGARKLFRRCGKGLKLKEIGVIDRDHESMGSTRGSTYWEFMR